MTPIGLFRRQFWEHLIACHPEEGVSGRACAQSYRWTTLGDLDVVVVQFVADTGVGVFIRGRKGECADTVRQRIQPNAAALEASLGIPIGTEDPERFFIIRLPLDTADRSTWDTAVDWLSENRKRYEAALRDIMGGTD